jgi:HEAT repeat protein
VSFALLASATAFEIIFDIVFWVVVAAYLDAFEFRRATPLVYMAFALGGAAGGVVGRIGAGAVPPADLLLLLLPAAALVVVQLGAVASRLREVPEYHADSADEALEAPGLILLGRFVRRYPLALLIALNALAGTLLYGLSEFLIVSIYEARFTSEAELAEFLSLLFAFMQILEFGLLYTLTRVLLERTGPLLRNLVFPLTSLGGLVFLTISPRLLAAVVVHVNIETLANVLLLPISNANYVPLPLGLQGRARTLSEGIFYPAGLALAGAVLWTADPESALLQVEFAALTFAALFVLLGAGVGLLFLPTLHANLGSGLITPGQTLSSDTAAPPVPRVSALLRSREPELRLLGIALARRLDPEALEADMRALLKPSDRATRTALAPLVAAAPEPWAQNFLDRCLAGDTEEELDLALLVLLIRRAQLKPEHIPRALGAHSPTVRALGHVVAQGLEAWPHVQPLVRKSGVASDLVDALLCAGRTDHAPLLLACLETAGPERQHRALAMLNASAEPPRGVTADLLRLRARRRHPAVRAEAIVSLSRTSPRSAAVRQLVAALDDPSPRVRRRAAQALCGHGDRATALLRARLCTVTTASIDAVWALAWIGSPRARRVLAAYIRMLQRDGERTAQLRHRIAASPDRACWTALELCLDDHHARMLDVILAALSPAIDPRLVDRLRQALQGGGPALPRQRVRTRRRRACVPPHPGRGRPVALPPVRARCRRRAAGRFRLGQARGSVRPGHGLHVLVGPARRGTGRGATFALTSGPASGKRSRIRGPESWRRPRHGVG